MRSIPVLIALIFLTALINLAIGTHASAEQYWGAGGAGGSGGEGGYGGGAGEEESGGQGGSGGSDGSSNQEEPLFSGETIAFDVLKKLCDECSADAKIDEQDCLDTYHAAIDACKQRIDSEFCKDQATAARIACRERKIFVQTRCQKLKGECVGKTVVPHDCFCVYNPDEEGCKSKKTM